MNLVNEQAPSRKSKLETAAKLEALGILKRGTAYRMAKEGQIPSYLVGRKGRGIRFRVDEVLTALRRPA